MRDLICYVLSMIKIAYHAIASHLLKSELGEAALIDTTGSFSPLRLRDVLAFRLQARLQRERYQQSGYMYEEVRLAREETAEGLVAKATSMLDRVKVMRVFDFAGVVEAISEVSRSIETHLTMEETGRAVNVKKRPEISDSEDELDDNEDPQADHAACSSATANGGNGRVGMLIIDTITNVVGSVMSKSQIQGQALLTSFMHSLHHLTHRYHICTLLVNAAVGLNSSSNPKYARRPEEHVSIFSSTLGKPALGKTFTFLVDTSIFMSAVPRTSKDATIAIGSSGDYFQKTFILEILKDRQGSREGRWAAFEIADGVKLVPFSG